MDREMPVVEAAVAAIREGRIADLRELLVGAPEIVGMVVRDPDRPEEGRSLLHIATDWPGHYPNGPETVSLLVELGAEIDAPFEGPHAETALHWAASSNDVAVLDRLLDLGANIDARGGVIAGGTALMDAVAFRQWDAARRLRARGAAVELGEAAALGDVERLKAACDEGLQAEEVNCAFWMACHGGQRAIAHLLKEEGADPNWLPPWERATSLDAATGSGFAEVAEWLRVLGAKAATQLG